jgi:hypothetical protein
MRSFKSGSDSGTTAWLSYTRLDKGSIDPALAAKRTDDCRESEDLADDIVCSVTNLSLCRTRLDANNAAWQSDTAS